MKKTRCFNCGGIFKSGTEKKIHKQKYPNGGCEGMVPINQLEEVQGRTIMEDKKTEEEIKEEPKIVRKSPIQKVDTFMIPAEQAKVEWKKYCELLKTRKDKHLKIMKQAMYFAKQGKAIIDIYQTIKKGGLSKKNEPRLAVARADINEVFFEKRDTGSGRFCMETGWNRGGFRTDVELPQNLFKINWERTLKPDGTPSWELKDKTLKAKVPMVPAMLMPEGDLKDYYILWEVKEWEQLPEAKDPFLMKRISENLFVVLGAWDITELERAVIGGLD